MSEPQMKEPAFARAPPSVSIVIPNYNYARFLPAAIDSALAQTVPATEVIVVDDGSTDESREVMESYGERIVGIARANGGQTAACNTGFARSRGDVVVFLDSDDALHPSFIDELRSVWRPGLSKVQVQMRVVDQEGKPTGAVLPQFPWVPSPEEIRTWARTAAAYPTPPGSGNAYSRTYLQRIFPLEGPDLAADSYCLAAAPYLGDVLTIAKPLVDYRIHGRNQGAMSALDVTRFAKEVVRASQRFRYAQQAARSVGMEVPDHAFDRSLSSLPYRLASFHLAREAHPVPGDTSAKLLFHVLRGGMTEQGMKASGRCLIVAWSLLVTLGPRPLKEQLVLWRFSSTQRPAVLNRVLRSLGAIQRQAMQRKGTAPRPLSASPGQET